MGYGTQSGSTSAQSDGGAFNSRAGWARYSNLAAQNASDAANSAEAAAASAAEAAVLAAQVGGVTPTMYLAPYSGAVSRTVATKLGDVVSVKDFGAAGDTTNGIDGTDDTPAFVAALATGKQVLVPEGKYRIIGTLTMTAGGLVGQGESESIIYMNSASLPALVLANGATGLRVSDLRITRSIAATSGGDGIRSVGNVVSHCNIQRVTLDSHWCGLALGPTDYGHIGTIFTHSNYSHGLYMACTATVGTIQWVVERVLAQFNDGSGFYVDGTPGNGTTLTSVSLGTWSEVTTFANTQYGLAFVGKASCSVNGVRVTSGFIGDDGLSCLYMDTHGYQHMFGNIFQENTGGFSTGRRAAPTAATSTGNGADITLYNGAISMSNCKFTTNSYSGISSTASGVLTLTGCVLTNNGRGSPTPGATDACGLRITGGAGAIISGGQVGSYGGGTDQQYGVYTNNGVNLSIIGVDMNGNQISPWAAAANVNYVQAVGNLPNTLNVGLSGAGAVLINGSANFTAAGTLNVGSGIFKNGVAYVNP